MCGVDKALFVLRSMNFYWRQNPIIILRNELRTLGLDYLASSKIWNNTTSNFCNIQTTSKELKHLYRWNCSILEDALNGAQGNYLETEDTLNIVMVQKLFTFSEIQSEKIILVSKPL